jgi:hypothetical protein
MLCLCAAHLYKEDKHGGIRCYLFLRVEVGFSVRSALNKLNVKREGTT